MRLNDVILQVGGEGGSVALYAFRTGVDWFFSLDFIKAQAVSTDDHVVRSWDDALLLLDRYPWHRLVPLRVHPDFRLAILKAVEHRYATEEGGPASENGSAREVPDKWRQLCAATSAAGDLPSYKTDGSVHSSDTWLYDDEVDEQTSTEEREYLRNEMLKIGLTEDDIKDMF